MLAKFTSIVAMFAVTAFAEKVSISNTECRRDADTGELMDTHDGNIVQWEANGLYWYYSMGYQDCTIEHSPMPPQECPGIYKSFGGCGFRADHALRIYSSPNLKDWSLESENALEMETRPYGIYFRPKVVYNALTQQYVLWVNHLPDDKTPLAAYGKAGYFVATSPTPNGPFTTVREAASLSQGAAGDADIFVDENGTDAYIVYNGWYNDHTLYVEKLNAEFTESLGSEYISAPVSANKQEAPAMFQRNGYYYMLYGHTCCFCREGSGAHLQIAEHPLGPWTDTGIELNPKVKREYTVKGQNSWVMRVAQADGTTGYVFVSDLWSTAADDLKSHDTQFWTLLEFDDTVTPPTIKPFSWSDTCELDLATNASDELIFYY